MRTPPLTGRLPGHIVYALSVFPASGRIVGLTLTQTYEVLRHYDYGRRGAGFRGGRARTHVSPRLPLATPQPTPEGRRGMFHPRRFRTLFVISACATLAFLLLFN